MGITMDRVLKYGRATAYIFASFLSFYCCCYRLPVGVKYIMNMAIFAWAALEFMIKPRFSDLRYCARFMLLYSITFLLPWVWSVLIWIYEMQTFDYIVRGSLNIIYMITNNLYACASYYLFGATAIPYMLISMAMANGAVFLEVGMKNGIGELLSQYVQLVITFAGNTGQLVRKMELHDMVFGWGVFIIYYAMQPTKKKWQRWVFLAVSVFFFTLGFKRIGIIAVVMSIGVYFIYKRMSEHARKVSTRLLSLAFIAAAFGYIFLVRSGIFYMIADALDINLMGRKTIFSAYESFYSLSPFYVGHGVRFIFQYGSTVNGITALHNDFLGLYIEVGFIIWFIWIWYEFSFRFHWVGKQYSYKAAMNLIVASVYVYINFMTDNTFYYFPSNSAYRLAAMAWCFSVICENNPQATNQVVNDREILLRYCKS